MPLTDIPTRLQRESDPRSCDGIPFLLVSQVRQWRARRFGSMLERFRNCLIGNRRSNGLAKGIQFSELAFRQGGFVDHADVSGRRFALNVPCHGEHGASRSIRAAKSPNLNAAPRARTVTAAPSGVVGPRVQSVFAVSSGGPHPEATSHQGRILTAPSPTGRYDPA